MKNTLILICSILLWLGCERSPKTTEVSGIVIDKHTRAPIANAKLSLRDGPGGRDLLTGEVQGTDAYSTAITDEHGAFELAVSGRWGAYLSLNHGEYWPYVYIGNNGGWSASSKAYDNGTVKTDEVLELEAFAEMQLYFTSAIGVGKCNFFTLNPDLTLQHPGLYKDFSVDKKTFEITAGPRLIVGNTFLRYKLEVLQEGTWREKVDSFYVEKGAFYRDTLTF